MQSSGITVVTLVAVVCLASCDGTLRETPRSSPGQSAKVRLASVVRSGGDALESVPGVLAATQRATLASRIPATVVELPFQEGAHVTQGAVIVRLDAAALRSAERAAEAAWKAADMDLARVDALLAEKVAAPREHDEAMARAAAARAALLGARDNLSYAVLRAPFDGVVVARPVHVGDVVSPGMSLLEIEGESGLEIRATVDGALAPVLRTGQRLQAEVDTQPTLVPVTVRSISPAADPATHRAEVRADLAPRPGLSSGLFARLLVPRGDAPVRLVVPSAALVRRGGLSGVFVVAEDHARLRWVALGESRDGVTELRAGVEAGERVVLDPAGLVDGAPVEAAQ